MYIRKVLITPGMREAAKLFDVPVSAVRHAVGIMKYRPDLEKEVVAGRMSLFVGTARSGRCLGAAGPDAPDPGGRVVWSEK